MLAKFRKTVSELKANKKYNYNMFRIDYLPGVLYATMMNQVNGYATLQPDVEAAIKKFLQDQKEK